MEQVYNYTQNEPVVHYMGIRNNAEDIKTKADQLNGTAESKSTEELTNTRVVDIQGTNKKGDQLATKANLLKGKAEELYNKAESLRSEAAKVPESPLKDLSGPARQLKDAAKGSGNTDLYNAANELATHTGGTGLENKATNVISAFDTVKTAYNALMAEAKTIKQQGHEKVTDVESEYTQLNVIYDEMLNLTKLAVKAKELTQLGDAATNLDQKVKDLCDNQTSRSDYTNAQQVIQQFESVEYAYNKLTDTDKPDVQEKFEALKTLYDKIFKFTKIKHYSTELSTAAEQLPGGSGDPKKVIINFNAVVTAYKALGETESIVKSDFEELQEEYSKAIYSYKFHFITLPSS